MSGLRQAVLSAGSLLGINQVFRRINRNGFRILAYHGVDENQDPMLNYDGFQVHPERFREQMEFLTRFYRVVSLQDVLQAYNGGSELPRHAAVITFDDGYRNNLETAVPILSQMGLPATFFVTTGFVQHTHRPWWYIVRKILSESEKESFSMLGMKGPLVYNVDRCRAMVQVEQVLQRKTGVELREVIQLMLSQHGVDVSTDPYPLLDIEGVKKLELAGFEVHPHTVSHISLGHEDQDKISDEIDLSVMAVENWTGFMPNCFAYPYGRTLNIGGHKVRDLLRRKGIELAVTTIEGINTLRSHQLMLQRLNITQNHTPDRFEALLSGFTLATR